MMQRKLWSRIGLLLILFWAGVLSVGCGKKGPPIVPQIVTPQAVLNLKAEAGCNRIVLSFTKPDLNSDGSAFNDFYGFQVYRQILKARVSEDAETIDVQTNNEETKNLDSILRENQESPPEGTEGELTESPPVPPDKRGLQTREGMGKNLFRDEADAKFKKLLWIPVTKKFKKINEFSMKELKSIEGAGFYKPDLYPDGKSPIHFFDSGEKLDDGFQPEIGFVYQYMYKIRLINEDDDYSPFSNTTKVIYGKIPNPPSDLQWERNGNGIRLYWDPPLNDCTGKQITDKLYFNIFKQEQGKKPSDKPINSLPFTGYSYAIDSMERDVPFVFAIKTVLLDPFRQSEKSTEIDITVADITPPGIPTGLVAIGGFQLVSLLWEPVQDKDLLGYNIYRRASGTAEWEKINPTPTPGTTFVDRKVDMSREYDYAVTAVDRSTQRNESEKSTLQKVTFR